jgi:isopenicillin-N synthase
MSETAEASTIDISPLAGANDASKRRVAAEIDRACRGSGFFYAAGHGVDVAQLQDEVAKFHQAMTDDDKYRIAINAYNPASTHRRSGYYMAIKGVKAVESFCYLTPEFNDQHPIIRAGTPMHEINKWPDDSAHPRFREYCEAYFVKVFDLSRILLRGFALALGRSENYFAPHLSLKDTLSAVSLIRYPYLDDYPPVKVGPDGAKLSFEDHQDVSMITVLFQTPVANLQVQTPQGWLDVPTSAEDFLINCGTYMAHLTNGYYPAPVHRVKWVNAERLSLPFFVHPASDTKLTPFNPHCLSDGGNQPVRYGEYLAGGLSALIRKNGQT